MADKKPKPKRRSRGVPKAARRRRAPRDPKRKSTWKDAAASMFESFMSPEFAEGFNFGCKASMDLFPDDPVIAKVVPERLLQAARSIVGDARAAVQAVMSGQDPMEVISRRHRTGVGEWLGRPGKN